MTYYCYIITNGNLTYNGYTVDLKKRLRQHNGELVGGAKSTANKGTWKYLLVMTSEIWNTISDAMKCEWLIRYPTRKKPRPSKYKGIIGRINSLSEIFVRLSEINSIELYVDDVYYDMILNCNYPIKSLNKLNIIYN